MNVKEKLTKARVGLLLSSPFYASVALHLELKEDLSHPTAYTDSVVIGYNPKYIETLSDSCLKALICHEVLHVVMLHALREGHREHRKWNVACDYAINPIVKMAGYNIPDDWLYDKKYEGLEAEVIYNMLPDTSGPAFDGSTAGEVKPYIQDKDKDGYTTPIKQQVGEWKIKIASAINIAKMQGDIPEKLRRLVDSILEAKISWKEILSRFVVEKSRNDYSWKQPNKRYLYAGMYLPKLEIPCLGTIVVIVDTSGSVCQKELSEFGAELHAVLSIYPGTSIKVIYVDSKISNIEDIDVYNFKLHAKGGGGTDFRPGFEYIEKEGISPALVIYFTDGYCRSFPEAPDFPVLWALTDKAGFVPPFGEVIYIEEEK